MTRDTINEYRYGDGQPEGATVREILTSAYGEDFARDMGYVFTVTERRWYEYHNDGPAYANGYQPMRHVWHESGIIVINHTKSNDVHGYEDPVEVANYRVLYEAWSELDGLSYGPYSNCRVIALDLDKPAPSDLIDVLESLESYPVIDEQEWSKVEQEMIQEHWNSYGRNDALDTVAKAIGLDSCLDLTEAAEEIVNRLVWNGILDYGCGGGYPTMIDTSACDFGDSAVAEFINANLGNVVTVKTQNGYGDPVEIDLTRDNVIA